MANIILLNTRGAGEYLANFERARNELVLVLAESNGLRARRGTEGMTVQGTTMDLGCLMRELHERNVGGLCVDVGTPAEAEELSAAGRFRYVTSESDLVKLSDWHDRIVIRDLGPTEDQALIATSELAVAA